ncbi:hypothetical protein IT417_02320 [bacterium]|nr:hypothetical protein [bacterium]
MVNASTRSFERISPFSSSSPALEASQRIDGAKAKLEEALNLFPEAYLFTGDEEDFNGVGCNSLSNEFFGGENGINALVLPFIKPLRKNERRFLRKEVCEQIRDSFDQIDADLNITSLEPGQILVTAFGRFRKQENGDIVFDPFGRWENDGDNWKPQLLVRDGVAPIVVGSPAKRPAEGKDNSSPSQSPKKRGTGLGLFMGVAILATAATLIYQSTKNPAVLSLPVEPGVAPQATPLSFGGDGSDGGNEPPVVNPTPSLEPTVITNPTLTIKPTEAPPTTREYIGLNGESISFPYVEQCPVPYINGEVRYVESFLTSEEAFRYMDDVTGIDGTFAEFKKLSDEQISALLYLDHEKVSKFKSYQISWPGKDKLILITIKRMPDGSTLVIYYPPSLLATAIHIAVTPEIFDEALQTFSGY